MDKAKLPLISVIMPAYNSSNFISEAIHSVIIQSYTNWELLIINDGSTDTTSEIALNFCNLDSRIKYYYQENGKQGKARNLGISKANGEFIAFLDADDLWLSEKLEIQIKEIFNRNVDLIFSNSYIIYGNESNVLNETLNIPSDIYHDRTSIPMFLKKNRVPILTVLVKKAKLIEVNGFSEIEEIQNVEDYHLWLKLLMSNATFYSVKGVLAKYRFHNDSVTSNDKVALKKIPFAFFDLMTNNVKYKNEIKLELKYKFILIYYNNLFTKSELRFWIEKNTTYLSKSNFKYLYLFLNSMLPTKVTKRILIYILNA
jgi:teichuronic acid biosynthesis glycosyltransferase TuaG